MRIKVIMAALPLVLAGCQNNSVPIVDDAGNVHYTASMDSDSRGSFSFPSSQPATGHKVFVFDPNIPAWAAYDGNGQLIKTGSASGGRDFCPDVNHECRTVTGTFHVYSKKGPDCTSSVYPIETNGGAKMPYCMHFYQGYSIHAAYEVPKWNASHGCIRVLPDAARWLNQEFMNIGTTVIVKPYSS